MTCPYNITLTTPGLTAVTIGDGGDFGLRSLDLGFPEIREETINHPGADGTIDNTRLFGRRLITAEILLVPGSWLREQDLRAFLSPMWRSAMKIAPDNAPELVTTVRGAGLTAPVVLEDLAAGVKRISAQWVAPRGVLESAVENTAVANAAGSTASPGRSYSLSFDRDYPNSPPSGSAVCSNSGTANAYPLLRVYGPCFGPVVQHLGTGQELAFPALTIAEGDFLEIDTRVKTIRYNGNAADSRYGELDFTTSEWWSLSPGEQRIRFLPDTFTAPSQVQITWRDAWV